MEWQRLITEDQLPFDQYFLVINENPGSCHHIPDLMRDDGSFAIYDGDELILRCYEGTMCRVNYFDPNISTNYTHFMIIDLPKKE